MPQKPALLLCTDLDRTIIPNGPEEESTLARPRLRRLAARPEVTFAFVSGRHKGLMLEALHQYDLPLPDFAIGDVGSTIYALEAGEWRPWRAWEEAIAGDWNGFDHDDLADLLASVEGLTLQEREKQNRFKLSFYLDAKDAGRALASHIEKRLRGKGVAANLIWSTDDITHSGLLDILPRGASKVAAIRFLMSARGFGRENTLFAGDSGNDLSVLTSGLQSVLVANARPAVREQALRRVAEAGHPHSLYLARGGFLGMNGNYAAGVLEGTAHFMPHTLPWME